MEPLFVFAPGAGAPSSHPWMRHWATHLGKIGFVRTFDYPYMIEGSRRPNPLPQLIAAHREALQQAQQSHDGPVFLIGKSMGSRIGCHLSLQEKVAGLICLGYPLCGGGDPTKMRDKVLRQLSTPILFVQGTRDRLCPLALLAQVRGGMTAASELYVVEGGDHSLGISKTHLKASGETQEAVEERILYVIREFVAKLAPF